MQRTLQGGNRAPKQLPVEVAAGHREGQSMRSGFVSVVAWNFDQRGMDFSLRISSYFLLASSRRTWVCSTSGDGGSDASGTLHPDSASVLLSGATTMKPYCSAMSCAHCDHATAQLRVDEIIACQQGSALCRSDCSHAGSKQRNMHQDAEVAPGVAC